MRHHSTVCLVTNSSSETFTMSRTKIEELMYGHLQSVLDAAGITEGSGQSARDLFEIVVEPSDEYIESKIWEFQDSDAMTPELEAKIKQFTQKDWITDDRKLWPSDAIVAFDAWLDENGGPGVSLRVSNEDYYLDTPSPQGAVFVKNRETGAVDTKLSALAWGIIDIRKNGEGQY